MWEKIKEELESKEGQERRRTWGWCGAPEAGWWLWCCELSLARPCLLSLDREAQGGLSKEG